MESIIERIKRGHFWKFHGGIHPPEQKHLTQDKPIRSIPIPELLQLPLQQHIGQSGELIVNIGDQVLKGQPLTRCSSPMAVPVHAPTSGTITAIEHAVIAHPSGLKDLCIFLKPDGEEKWFPRTVCDDVSALSKNEIISKIANAGISGMGGAGFPTHIKANTNKAIDFLIINAAECEPYITADDLLIREHSIEIVNGIEILNQLVTPKHILIGIEDNKPAAIAALKQATSHIDNLKVCVLPTKYPTGGEKQLIKILIGKEVPSGVLPSSIGVVMQNIATCFAIADAVIHDIPLIRRVVTVSGQALEKPQNVWALLGTPVEHLLEHCSYQAPDKPHLIMGGPMMGFSLSTNKVPVVKTTNCILAPTHKEIPNDNKEVECIRCGQCAEVCPASLLPQELQWSAKAKDHDLLQSFNLFDCIECGACAYVCPSHIPLVHYYRVSKAEIRQKQLQEIKAEQAKARFEARKERLEKQKKAREEKHRKAAEARRARMNSGTPEGESAKSAVAAALARVKAKKAGTDEAQGSEEPRTAAKSQAAAAIARAKAKKLAAQKKQENTNDTEQNDHDSVQTTQPNNDKPSKVAAAVAKAKAKKLAEKQQNESITADDNPQTENATGTESKQTKVASAVAKAKAKALAKKKAEKKNSDVEVSDIKTTSSAKDSADNQEQQPQEKALSKSDKIAAAVAKAKAKKLAAKTENKSETATENTEEKHQQTSDVVQEKTQESVKGSSDDKNSSGEVSESGANSDADSKQAKIAAAIAKAKAKKQASKQNEQTATDETDSLTADTIDKSKADRIAAAIAKAKAKKQQQSESQ